MKNKLTNLGFALSREAQKQIIGGEVIEIIDGTPCQSNSDCPPKDRVCTSGETNTFRGYCINSVCRWAGCPY